MTLTNFYKFSCFSKFTHSFISDSKLYHFLLQFIVFLNFKIYIAPFCLIVMVKLRVSFSYSSCRHQRKKKEQFVHVGKTGFSVSAPNSNNKKMGENRRIKGWVLQTHTQSSFFSTSGAINSFQWWKNLINTIKLGTNSKCKKSFFCKQKYSMTNFKTIQQTKLFKIKVGMRIEIISFW